MTPDMNEMRKAAVDEGRRITALEFRRFHTNGKPAFEVRMDATGVALIGVIALVLLQGSSPTVVEGLKRFLLEVVQWL